MSKPACPKAVLVALLLISVSGCLSSRPPSSDGPPFYDSKLRLAYETQTGDVLEFGDPAVSPGPSGGSVSTLPFLAQGIGRQANATSFVAEWNLDEGGFLRFGTRPNWTYAHLPEHDLTLPFSSSVFLVSSVLMVRQSGNLQEGPFQFSRSGSDWSGIQHRLPQGIHWQLAIDFDGRIVRLNLTFSAGAFFPNKITVNQWDLEWELEGREIQIGVSGGGPIIPLSKFSGGTPVAAIAQKRPPTYAVLTGSSFRGPDDTGALNRFPLSDALNASRLDSRVNAFFQGTPSTFLENAFLRPDPRAQTALYVWILVFGGSCPTGQGSHNVIVVTVERPRGAAVAIVATADSSTGECLYPRGNAVLRNEWVSILEAVRAVEAAGWKTAHDDDSTFVGFAANVACDPESPWSIQVGFKNSASEIWISLVNAQVLSVREVGGSAVSGIVQQVECGRYFPI